MNTVEKGLLSLYAIFSCFLFLTQDHKYLWDCYHVQGEEVVTSVYIYYELCENFLHFQAI